LKAVITTHKTYHKHCNSSMFCKLKFFSFKKIKWNWNFNLQLNLTNSMQILMCTYLWWSLNCTTVLKVFSVRKSSKFSPVKSPIISNLWGPQGSRDYSYKTRNHCFIISCLNYLLSNCYKIIRFQFIGFLLIYLETKILYFNI
jgi:hypothetical protein